MAKWMSNTRIALDGPSALMLYRDRDEQKTQFVPWYSTHVHISAEAMPELSGDEGLDDDLFWLSDEDVAQTLAETNIFGKWSTTRDNVDEETEPGDTPLRRTRTRSFTRCVANLHDIKQMPLASLGVRPPSEDSPLFLLVSNAEQRTQATNVHVRIHAKQFSSNALYRLGDHVLVPTPEFTFLLLAGYLSVVELVMVGMELCGYYRLAGGTTSQLLQSNRTLYSRHPLTTIARLKLFLENMKGFPGASDAMRACKYLEQGSASPMETALYLLLCLPRMLGGYAIAHPILNGKRAVNKHAQSFTLSQYLIPDLYWPGAKLDAEYDSEAFHASPESLKNGARRTLALRAMHVEVVSITSEMLHDADAFDAVARLIAKKTNKRLRPVTSAFDECRSVLRSIVL